MWPPSEVPTQSTSLHAEVRDEGPANREIERSSVVLGMVDGCTAAASGKVGRHDSCAALGQPLGKKIKVAAVARQSVHADYRSLGIVGSPCRIAHLREAVRAQGEELSEARA